MILALALILLSWVDAVNPPATAYNVYRANGRCSAMLVFSRITAVPVAQKTYSDTPSPGDWCYQVTAVVDGVESEPSAPLTVKTKPAAPTGLTATGAAAATPP